MYFYFLSNKKKKRKSSLVVVPFRSCSSPLLLLQYKSIIRSLVVETSLDPRGLQPEGLSCMGDGDFRSGGGGDAVEPRGLTRSLEFKPIDIVGVL